MPKNPQPDHFAWKAPCQTVQKYFIYSLLRYGFQQGNLNTWDSIIQHLQKIDKIKEAKVAKTVQGYCDFIDSKKGKGQGPDLHQAYISHPNNQCQQHLDIFVEVHCQPNQEKPYIKRYPDNEFKLFVSKVTNQKALFDERITFNNQQEKEQFKNKVIAYSIYCLDYVRNAGLL